MSLHEFKKFSALFNLFAVAVIFTTAMVEAFLGLSGLAGMNMTLLMANIFSFYNYGPFQYWRERACKKATK